MVIGADLKFGILDSSPEANSLQKEKASTTMLFLEGPCLTPLKGLVVPKRLRPVGHSGMWAFFPHSSLPPFLSHALLSLLRYIIATDSKVLGS